jgi:hypothetical protein
MMNYCSRCKKRMYAWVDGVCLSCHNSPQCRSVEGKTTPKPTADTSKPGSRPEWVNEKRRKIRESKSKLGEIKQRGVIMTTQREWILKYLEGRGWTSPTQIGRAYGDSIHGGNSPSAWASPKCKALVRHGLIDRNDDGWYRLRISPEN